MCHQSSLKRTNGRRCSIPCATGTATGWLALENTLDSHNCFWVHRNAIIQLRNRFGGRPRTPLGYRTKIVNNKAAVVADRGGATNYYAKDGTVPYQMYYPRTGGYWPPTRFRLLWIWFFRGGATGTSRPRQSSRRPKSGAAA